MNATAPPSGHDAVAALGRSAAALEQRGDWEGAARGFSAQFRLAAAERAMDELVNAIRGGARVRYRQGRHDEAEELALLGEEMSRALGMPRAAARALNVRALIRYSLRDLEGAAVLYAQALEEARQVRDDELIGLVCQNLGVIANIQGDLLEARALYLESIAASLRSGDKAAAIGAYANLGAVCSDLRDWLESELYFEHAIELAEMQGHRPHLARMRVAVAEPLIHMGEFSRARLSLDAAERMLDELEDAELAVGIRRIRATLARAEGDHDAADDHLRQGLDAAERGGYGLEAAETLAEWARLRWAQERHAEAHTFAAAARQRFRAVGARREVDEMERLLAGWEGGEPE
ncbi:tetratricopeptide repeat protein [Longimicrobium sp.]|uniref:tetratricopeptide repeat protein n=1 Tax=Longimicrobium sp. TaxID=2029185 RepID=UPI002EDAABC3